MRKRSFWSLMPLIFLMILCGCNGEKKKVELPSSKGIPYELLLVVDRNVWNSTAGDSLQAVLKGSVPGLPQHEPMFKMLRVYPENYVQMYTTMRNTMFVSLDSTLAKPRLSVAYNVKARPQVVVSLKAPDTESLIRMLMSHRQEIVDYFVESELNLEAARLKQKYHRDTEQAAVKIFGYRICVPDEMRSMKQREQFLWASTELNEKDLNLVMYTFPYDAGADLSQAGYWTEKRDSVMKKNIPGSTPDQWMTTTREENVPLVGLRERVIDGAWAWELRGLWELRHGGIGGPFVSLARIDSAENKVIVCEGFVYSPRTDKRDLMRRMEASLRTLEKIKK